MGYPSKVEPYRSVFVERIVNEFTDNGNRCTVICPIRRKRKREFTFGSEIHYSKSGNKVNVFFPLFRCIYTTSRMKNDPFRRYSINACYKAVEKCIEDNHISFDVVYAHFLGVSTDVALRVGQKYDKKVFAAAGESNFYLLLSPEIDLIIKSWNQLCGIISVSSENKKILLEHKVLDEKRIKVFPNGIDTKSFHPYNKEECRKEFGFQNDCFIVGFVGYFIDRKGPDRIVDALRGSDIKMAFAGKGELEPELKTENTIYCGSVEPSKIPMFLSDCDIFVLPTKKEGCCNAIIEAMACGLPIVSSDRSFNDDILSEEYSIRVNPEDINEIREAVRILRSNNDMRKNMSTKAQERAMELDINERALGILNWVSSMMEGVL